MPETGIAADVANEILSIIANANSASTLQAVVCDGSVTNTGKRNGVIRKLEKGVARPLQWQNKFLLLMENVQKVLLVPVV